MIQYIKSVEFWIGVIVTALCIWLFGVADLANYVQDSTIMGWSYVVYRQHQHHKMLQLIVGERDTAKES